MADGLAGGRAGGRLLLASVSGLNASPIGNFFYGVGARVGVWVVCA